MDKLRTGTVVDGEQLLTVIADLLAVLRINLLREPVDDRTIALRRTQSQSDWKAYRSALENARASLPATDRVLIALNGLDASINAFDPLCGAMYDTTARIRGNTKRSLLNLSEALKYDFETDRWRRQCENALKAFEIAPTSHLFKLIMEHLGKSAESAPADQWDAWQQAWSSLPPRCCGIMILAIGLSNLRAVLELPAE